MSNEPLLPSSSPHVARPAPPAAAAAISNTLSNASSNALSHVLSNASSDAASEHLQYDDDSRHVPVSSGGNGGDVAVPINRLTSVEWAEMGALVAETTPEYQPIAMPPDQQPEPRDDGSQSAVNQRQVAAVPQDSRRRGGAAKYLRTSLYSLFFGSRINLLLVFVPVTFFCVAHNLPSNVIFTFSLLSLVPLAERLGFVTEQLALCTNPTLGGLLNATFSNAPELIIVMVALRSGLVRVIQLSLLGSILGNLLLCLGSAFLAGGMVHRNLRFNKPAAQMNCGALMLAMSGLLFPNLLHATGTELHENASELALSRLAAVLMLVAYFAYIYFQLFTHKDLFEGGPDGDGGAGGDAEGGGEAEEEEEEEEHSVLGFWGGVFWLALVSALISVISDYLVNSVDGAAEEWNVPVSGLCVVVLPLVNNVTEHTSAILFGIRNKLDVSLSIAVGSSIQLAMFLIPLAVIGGWAIDVPMDLNFHRFETCTLFITVLATVLTLHEGSANWLKGFMFVLMYLILAATFFNHKEDYLEPQAAAAVADAAAGAAAAAAAGGVQTIASPVLVSLSPWFIWGASAHLPVPPPCLPLLKLFAPPLFLSLKTSFSIIFSPSQSWYGMPTTCPGRASFADCVCPYGCVLLLLSSLPHFLPFTFSERVSLQQQQQQQQQQQLNDC
ncbi:unnamed protein product [Closterium sp. NIES-54]